MANELACCVMALSWSGTLLGSRAKKNRFHYNFKIPFKWYQKKNLFGDPQKGKLRKKLTGYRAICIIWFLPARVLGKCFPMMQIGRVTRGPSFLGFTHLTVFEVASFVMVPRKDEMWKHFSCINAWPWSLIESSSRPSCPVCVEDLLVEGTQMTRITFDKKRKFSADETTGSLCQSSKVYKRTLMVIYELNVWNWIKFYVLL